MRRCLLCEHETNTVSVWHDDDGKKSDVEYSVCHRHGKGEILRTRIAAVLREEIEDWRERMRRRRRGEEEAYAE